MIDLRMDRETLRRNVTRARENGVVLPTFRQMKDPSLVPNAVRDRMKATGLWEVSPANLFRVTWKNEPAERGGLYGGVNRVEIPPALSGVRARIVALVGKWFPTGCHKVGAAFGCLLPRLVTGQFDASRQKAVWPSTGNYCRGGAFFSRLLTVDSVAILPEGMSRERFEWLKSIAGEVIATPGSESNVKEIFDKTWEIRRTRSDAVILNQFDEMGNHLWHYELTGNAMAEVFEEIRGPKTRFAGACFTTGSAGTIAAGDRLRELYPGVRVAAGEALQCPTLLENGFGAHRIEGIGDKHVPWIHNVRNTDMVIAIDDEDSQRLLRLFNEPAGREFLAREAGLDAGFANSLGLLGISGIANLLCCVKMAKYYELDENDLVMTVLTDSADLYLSRVAELREAEGAYSPAAAERDFARHLRGIRADHMLELGYRERKRIHNLKYYTWVEQQGRRVEDLNRLWEDPEGTWGAVHRQTAEIDGLIEAFNEAVGL